MRIGTRVEYRSTPQLEGTVTDRGHRSGWVVVTWDDDPNYHQLIAARTLVEISPEVAEAD